MSIEVPYDDSLMVKVVHAIHHQGSESYGNYRGIQCSWCSMLDLVKAYCIVETSCFRLYITKR